jgi:hypothetical protein
VNVYSVAPPKKVLVAELSNLANASPFETPLIEIYSKLSVPPLKLLAYTVPVYSPPAQPGVTLRMIGFGVAVGGNGVDVAGNGVAVGGNGVAVAGNGVAVAGNGVAVGTAVGTAVGHALRLVA